MLRVVHVSDTNATTSKPAAKNILDASSRTSTPTPIKNCTPATNSSPPIHPCSAQDLSFTSTPSQVHTCTHASAHTSTLNSNLTPIQTSPAQNLSDTSTPAPIQTCSTPVQTSTALNFMNALSGPVESIPNMPDSNNCMQPNASFSAFNSFVAPFPIYPPLTFIPNSNFSYSYPPPMITHPQSVETGAFPIPEHSSDQPLMHDLTINSSSPPSQALACDKPDNISYSSSEVGTGSLVCKSIATLENKCASCLNKDLKYENRELKKKLEGNSKKKV